MNMDRFRAPDASDEIARCQSCGERFHYTQMDEHGHCPTCQLDEDEDNDMTEKEMRALDSFCAGQVMGWNAVRSIHDLNSKKDFCVSGIERYCWIVEHGNNIKKFSPTTDPAAAMQVLEKCLNKCRPQLVIGFDETIFYVQQSDGRLNSESRSLPLAICLFARKLYETKT